MSVNFGPFRKIKPPVMKVTSLKSCIDYRGVTLHQRKSVVDATLYLYFRHRNPEAFSDPKKVQSFRAHDNKPRLFYWTDRNQAEIANHWVGGEFGLIGADGEKDQAFIEFEKAFRRCFDSRNQLMSTPFARTIGEDFEVVVHAIEGRPDQFDFFAGPKNPPRSAARYAAIEHFAQILGSESEPFPRNIAGLHFEFELERHSIPSDDPYQNSLGYFAAFEPAILEPLANAFKKSFDVAEMASRFVTGAMCDFGPSEFETHLNTVVSLRMGLRGFPGGRNVHWIEEGKSMLIYQAPENTRAPWLEVSLVPTGNKPFIDFRQSRNRGLVGLQQTLETIWKRQLNLPSPSQA